MKTVLVVGGTSGIGLEAVLKLVNLGHKIVFTGSNKQSVQKTSLFISNHTNHINYKGYVCSLDEKDSLDIFFKHYKKEIGCIDVLVLNAGSVFSKREVNSQGVEKQFAINYLSFFYITNLFLPLLKKSNDARVICTTSRAHRRGSIHFDDLQLKKSYSLSKAYNQSKLAVLLFVYHLSDKLKDSPVTINAFHPGLVNTNFGQKNMSKLHNWVWNTTKVLGRSAKKASKDIVFLTLSESLVNTSGKYFHKKKMITSSKYSYNHQAMQRLWNVSLELVQLSDSDYGKSIE